MTQAAPVASTSERLSPSTRPARTTVTTGSKVDTMLAVGAPTRSIPAKRAAIGTTVAMAAMRATDVQPSAVLGYGSPPRTRPAAVKEAVAPVATRAASSNGVDGGHHPLAGQDVAGVDGGGAEAQGQPGGIDPAGQ